MEKLSALLGVPRKRDLNPRARPPEGVPIRPETVVESGPRRRRAPRAFLHLPLAACRVRLNRPPRQLAPLLPQPAATAAGHRESILGMLACRPSVGAAAADRCGIEQGAGRDTGAHKNGRRTRPLPQALAASRCFRDRD